MAFTDADIIMCQSKWSGLQKGTYRELLPKSAAPLGLRELFMELLCVVSLSGLTHFAAHSSLSHHSKHVLKVNRTLPAQHHTTARHS